MNKTFHISDLFDVINNPQLDKENFTFSKDAQYPYFTRTENNNGILGYVEYLDEDHKIIGNSLAVGMISMKFHYMAHDFYAGQFTKTLIPKFVDFDETLALFFISVLNKHSAYYQSYLVREFVPRVNNTKIDLPVIENPNPDHEYTVNDIDWQYMRDRITELERDRITELERDRITELDAYLQATGLNDYELTEDDKKILSLSAKRTSDENGTLEDNSEDGVRIAPFELTELFIKKTIKGVPKKDEDLTENLSGYHIFGQNIKYQYEHKVLMDEKYLQIVEPNKPILAYTSSVGEIGMITESFYRTGDNGAFQGLFPLFDIDEYAMRYILTVLQKHFADFGYATSMANIMSMKIYLPIKSDDTPDFDYMERYIRAMEKVVIADVVKYKDKVIETTKKVVGE